jgi:hypothetical protein
MVRVGGIQYTVNPNNKIGSRISNMTLKGKPCRCQPQIQGCGLGAGRRRRYRHPIWDVVATYCAISRSSSRGIEYA